MKENELWEMFAKTGDVDWYNMYRAMKEDKEYRARKKRG